jgi:hypothetical protein
MKEGQSNSNSITVVERNVLAVRHIMSCEASTLNVGKGLWD